MGTVYLYPGMVFAEAGEHEVSTVLGSCVAVCLWDHRRRVGGMNHFLLPLWNGEGLASPRYGNVAIARLVARLRELGCSPRGLRAKLFGGGTVASGGGLWNIGERNGMVARDLLGDAGIPVVASDLGGTQSRRLRFLTATGEVFLKRIPVLPPSERRARPAVVRDAGGGERVRVLVVDDSKALRLLIGTALRRAGHEVAEAADGVEGLAALADPGVGCVVCDLNMPRMDGLEFVGRLRATPGHERTPVVMLTTESGAQAVERGESAGVRAWIVKPFRAEQLLEAVAEAAAAG